MTLKTAIRDGSGFSHLAGVTNANELLVAGFGDNQTRFVLLNANTTAFNFFSPKSGQNFYITSILFNIGGGATTMNIYESISPTATITATDKELIRIVTATTGFIPITLPFGGFIKVTEGMFLNAQTTSQPNSMTIIGFYKPVPKIINKK